MSELYRILRLMRPFWRRVLLALALSALTIASSVGLMMTAAWLISTAALQQGVASLGVAPVAVRFFGLSRAVFRYLERLVSHDVTFRLLARLRVWFYERIEPLSLVQLQSYRSGDLISRAVSDVEELQNFYLRLAGPPAVALVVTAATGLVFAAIDPLAALAAVAFMLGAGLLLPLLAWWIGARAGRPLVQSRAQLNSHLVDAVQGLPDSVAFGYADNVRRRIRTIGGQLAHWEQRMGWLDGLQSGASLLVVHLAAASVLWAALGRVDGVWLAALALGTVAAFEAITPLALAGQHLGQETAAARRVLEVMERAPAVPEGELEASVVPARPALALDRVTFRYAPGEPPVLDAFCLEIPYGTRVLVTGESGAGKSSLINVLLRFAEYEAGNITVGGVDLRMLQQESARQLFAVMTQRTHLFNTTIRENMRIGRKEAGDEAVAAAARAAQIHDFIQTLPDGYETYVGEGGALLSGGERQRVALARMLLKDAPIWLLDEVTANLDPAAATNVLRSVLAAGEGRTVILMTHRPALAAGRGFEREVRLGGG
ncbi:MAG TPA: thiol reductant ABC exporter subunit CydC [Candidatus Sulfomarinibacteraceae bacterium]|nr:thiol reductant ABC exporter subunit CydC [Candidatus Sulfomarinibacteraceae bacterium]